MDYSRISIFKIFHKILNLLTNALGSIFTGLIPSIAVADVGTVGVDAHSGRAAVRFLRAFVDVFTRVRRVVRGGRAAVACGEIESS